MFSLCVFIVVLLSHETVLYSQGYAPNEAVSHLRVAPGLRVSLFAHEPEVRQPIFVQCDDRGRLWTIQYLQYPNPAGLERVKVDRWSRTVYDRVPDPPPRGPRGKDRITIVEDVDRDGRADRFKDFINGLNLVTGVAFGHGGVYVLNVPYLLYYPDRNRDDAPDADPQVLLQGFGMEDAQSFSNHLTWGPDGWLYGVNGSTTTCRIRGIEFQQGVWRYHPLRDEFELFCEGGANCYGLTFDRFGNLFYSTNGGPFVHAIQGGYFYKSFGKHGPLHNPFAFHFFAPLDCDSAPGGPPTGGTVYRGQLLPEQYHNRFLAGNFLGHTSSAWDIASKGSTVKARYASAFFEARDSWSGPTDLCVGPDGEIYISDFFDQRTAHPDPDASWDDSNGRIYRIDVPNYLPQSIEDVRNLSTSALVDRAIGKNVFRADRARVELAFRRDRSALQRLSELVLEHDDELLTLDCLWAIYVIDGLPDGLAISLLEHPSEHVRAWVARLVADDRNVSPHVSRALATLASREKSLIVRAALASSAKRLPATFSLPIVWSLLQLQNDLPDERVEWSLWWAVEDKAVSDPGPILEWANDNRDSSDIATLRLIDLLIRRYAAEGRADSYGHCANLLTFRSQAKLDSALQSLRDGLAERSVQTSRVGQGNLFESVALPDVDAEMPPARQFEPVSGPLFEFIQTLWKRERNHKLALEIALQCAIKEAHEYLRNTLVDSRQENLDFDTASVLLGKHGHAEDTSILLKKMSNEDSESRLLLLVDTLAKLANEDLSSRMLEFYARHTTEVRNRIRQLLIARPDSCLALLRAVDRGTISSIEVPLAQLGRVALHKNAELDALVRKHWGNIGPGTPEEKLATMRRFSNDLRAAKGDSERGKAVFAKICGNCHKLFGEGGSIGPDLTSTTRGDQASLLASLVDPSAIVRREYMNYVVHTQSGNVHTGLLAEQDGASITLLTAENRRTRIGRSELEELRESPVSIMPERLLEQLSPQQLRDLFAYLQR